MRRRDHRFRNSLVASVVVHAAAMWLAALVMQPRPQPPEERVLTIELVSPGDDPAQIDGSPQAVAEVAEEPKPQPQPSPPEPRPLMEPQHEAPVAPPAPAGERAIREPEPTPPTPATPRSFEDWRSQRMARYAASLPSLGEPGGGDRGDDLMTSRGRDKCEPTTQRRVDKVYLLYDSSGSMNSVRKRQALTCAHQYAKASLARGAQIVVGNFAGSTTFSPPTRDLTEVEFALRNGTNPHATILPAKELNPFLDQDPRARADLVIVSDGFIPNHREVLPWYRYFLDLNGDNRGMMFTVGSPGHPDVLDSFRSIGFDVFVYRAL